MPTYLSPGVYVEEAEAGARPVEGVGTAVSAFVGFAEKGPFNTPTLVTNWTQFTQGFGGFVPDTYLAHAVYGYLANGGSACYVVRVGSDNAESNGQGGAQQQLAPAPSTTIGPYRVVALDAGEGAGQVTVEIAESKTETPPQDSVRFVVLLDGKQTEEYDPVVLRKGAAKQHNLMTVVNGKSRTIRVEEVTTSGAVEKVDKGRFALPAPPAPAPT
ncbi:MAG: phage tail sheath family protein, partial [Sciscionella sp.]